ncbi:MAG: ADP-ribosylglycohydrolase family protein [Dehalococcoidia bacterium]|nr:MAG: ADP-ribosylglycohydrolase family protein [Dehalococcoidia bacterium]
MNKQVMKSKFLGALVGTGVGDALGAPFEGRWQVSPEQVEAAAERLEALIYTDDTHMMIGMAESLIKSEGFDGRDMTYTFIRNYELEPFRGYGPGPPRIFRAIRAGAAWDTTAQELYGGGSFGNGSAMRIAPVGVFYYDDPAMLREVAHKSSQITHAHRLGKEGAALQAYAVALATKLEHKTAFDQDNFLTKLTDFVEEVIYKEKLAKIKELIAQPDRARAAMELGNGIEAFNSVPSAIYSFLIHPDSFAQAVIHAVSLGGDTDTIGAMTGAIAGAYLGVEAIPNQWRDKLENRLYLTELAEKLWQLKTTA